MNKLSDLAQEMEYQSAFSYEQRVDTFNKYFLSVSTTYINPIMLLTEHLRKMGGGYNVFHGIQTRGVSHSGAVQTAFNKEVKESKNKYVTIENKEKFTLYHIFNYDYSISGFSKVFMYKEMMETKEVSFKIYKVDDFFPKRGFCFYEEAEQFCKDFGFNLNFKK